MSLCHAKDARNYQNNAKKTLTHAPVFAVRFLGGIHGGEALVGRRSNSRGTMASSKGSGESTTVVSIIVVDQGSGAESLQMAGQSGSKLGQRGRVDAGAGALVYRLDRV